METVYKLCSIEHVYYTVTNSFNKQYVSIIRPLSSNLAIYEV